MFLHISQQTEAEPRLPEVKAEKYSRETQLCSLRNQSWNTNREGYTQMERRDLLLDSSFDLTYTPRKYTDSEEWLEMRNRACMNIQRCVRGWIARRQRRRLQNYAKEKHLFFCEREKAELAKAEESIRREIERRKHPRALSDFMILYRELSSWHSEEVEKINNAKLNAGERTNAMKELLLKEVKLLYAIEKLKARAAKVNHDDHLKKLMAKMSAPKIWELKNGKIVHVQTPDTARASDLMHLYMALAKDYMSIDERMGVLGYVKWTVQEFDCPLSKEILMLIEREADLMYRNRPAKALAGLRRRILGLFLQFLKTPKFNPEAAALQSVPVDFDFTPNQVMTQRRQPL